MNDNDIESEIQAKGLTAARVTPQTVDEAIAYEYYFTAAEGVLGEHALRSNETRGSVGVPESLGLLTICVLVLKNGFTVTGESACASPENFDAAIGRKIARGHARDKIWQLEGYLLKSRLSQ